MTGERRVNWILPGVITLLALADGVLHVTLDIIIFRGNFIGRLGPPPGAAPPANPPPGPPVPLPLPLNQLFLLNGIGYLVLIGLLWYALRGRIAWARWADVALLVYVAAAFIGWLDVGMPNPMGLGYLSKAVETVLAIVLLAHVWALSRSVEPLSEPGPRRQTGR